ncbi:MAG: sulfatase-like hydrolase/transferase [Chitinophagales bacterium]|nr:sulfatase-like hydrolase/transferase [Chitinophagales bacterium]
MIKKVQHIIHTRPVFLLLLPVFFVLHGVTENYDYIPAADALLLTSTYITAAILIALAAWIIYRQWTKACLMATALMAFHFFFGSMHDAIRSLAPNSFFSKHLFVLPFFFVLLTVFFLYLKKRQKPLLTLSFFLNSVLLILLLVDTGWLLSRQWSKRTTVAELPPGFTPCSQCPRPDIYFVVLDEYAGNRELTDLFQFNNQPFLDSLGKRGFYTATRSHSNYNYTPFSVASMLNMDYLQLQNRNRAGEDLTYCYGKIRDNRLLQFLRHEGYRFYNYSVFDFEGQPARTRETFLPAKTRLITAQTFLSRFDKEIRFNLITRFKSAGNLKILTYANRQNNEHIYSLTASLAEKKTREPKFVYTHLMMPHYPYFYDSSGLERPFEKLVEGNQTDTKAYTAYLQYANKKILALVDILMRQSANPPVIFLVGDHGFRHFTQPAESRYYFMNLSSVYLPGGNYGGFNDSLQGVNLLRVFLNNSFGQQLPLLPDSSIYLKD